MWIIVMRKDSAMNEVENEIAIKLLMQRIENLEAALKTMISLLPTKHHKQQPSPYDLGTRRRVRMSIHE